MQIYPRIVANYEPHLPGCPVAWKRIDGCHQHRGCGRLAFPACAAALLEFDVSVNAMSRRLADIYCAERTGLPVDQDQTIQVEAERVRAALLLQQRELLLNRVELAVAWLRLAQHPGQLDALLPECSLPAVLLSDPTSRCVRTTRKECTNPGCWLIAGHCSSNTHSFLFSPARYRL